MMTVRIMVTVIILDAGLTLTSQGFSARCQRLSRIRLMPDNWGVDYANDRRVRSRGSLSRRQ